MHGSLAKHMVTTELNVNRLTTTLSSNFGARYEQFTASYNATRGMDEWSTSCRSKHVYRTSPDYAWND